MWSLHAIFSVCTPLLIPVLISFYVEPDSLPLGALTFTSIITAMKLVSYAMCNGDLRHAPPHTLQIRPSLIASQHNQQYLPCPWPSVLHLGLRIGLGRMYLLCSRSES